MNTVVLLLIVAGIAFFVTLAATPLVIRLAVRLGVVDQPDPRKVHTRLMPRMGGLAIFVGYTAATAWMMASFRESTVIMLGALIIVATGVLDDRFGLRPWVKLVGQILSATVVVTLGMQAQFIHLPFSGTGAILEFGWLTIPLTIFWLVGVMNAVNLIDGLDGLAAGVTAIAATTMLILALGLGNLPVALMAAALIGSLIAFLFFNFHPAKIFMGDTGSLFLGYMMGVLSLLGFKQVAFTSFVVPLLILAVPLSDTTFAILRRLLSGRSIAQPDKRHLHHALLALGLSHRQAVLAIYGLSLFFGLSAILFSRTTLWWEVAILIVAVLVLLGAAEFLGLIRETSQLYGFSRRIGASRERMK